MQAWKQSGRVMQVGVQSTQLPVWQDARRRICEGQLGKVLQYQTEYFRNSDLGQWRYYGLAEDMTPQNIDWKMFLGTDFRARAEDAVSTAPRFGQWRCYWEFGSGMFTDLFVHRTTSMLLATGLRFPAPGRGRRRHLPGARPRATCRTWPPSWPIFPEGVEGTVTAHHGPAPTPRSAS